MSRSVPCHIYRRGGGNEEVGWDFYLADDADDGEDADAHQVWRRFIDREIAELRRTGAETRPDAAMVTRTSSPPSSG